jgi:hypothetical protein
MFPKIEEGYSSSKHLPSTSSLSQMMQTPIDRKLAQLYKANRMLHTPHPAEDQVIREETADFTHMSSPSFKNI